mmetsp:Transcript_20129/g.50812  ORF Transcript_20129/g.50812 Transcript_20129/m.50812 type:complete len:202 (-) Transcript_20129:3530-4135(-)
MGVRLDHHLGIRRCARPRAQRRATQAGGQKFVRVRGEDLVRVQALEQRAVPRQRVHRRLIDHGLGEAFREAVVAAAAAVHDPPHVRRLQQAAVLLAPVEGSRVRGEELLGLALAAPPDGGAHALAAAAALLLARACIDGGADVHNLAAVRTWALLGAFALHLRIHLAPGAAALGLVPGGFAPALVKRGAGLLHERVLVTLV